MLGYIAENLLSGLVKTAQWNEVDQYLNLGYQVVDVRTATEYADGTLPSAINLPVDEIRERVSELPGKKVLVTCQVGQRGHTATMYLKSLGYDAVNLDGGYLLWSNSPAKVSHKRKAISNV
jgi:rhodanese-related sulfurtransferase